MWQFIFFILRYHTVRPAGGAHTYGVTKKRELLKNPTKIEEIQEKKIVDRN